MRVHLLTVGDEILIGQIVDTNSAWMGQQLNLIGAEIIEITSVGDDHAAITRGLSHALSNADIVLMTGGLGPTKDDITKKAIADYFGVELVLDVPTFQRIEQMFVKRNIPLSEAHRLQSYMPSNATILQNKMGTAPGMWFEYKNRILVSMPGVPFEMHWIMEHEVMSRLVQRFKAMPISHRTIRTAGIGESQLATMIEDFEETLPPSIKVAYLPSLGQVKLRLTGRGGDSIQLNDLLDIKMQQLVSIVNPYVYGYDNETLESVAGNLLKQKKLTVSTLESCTGGLISHLLTTVPGASTYLTGSVVAYSNRIKTDLLKVSPDTLLRHGAVSEQTVKEMIVGGLSLFNTDIAISVSGIAGPDGGTPEKPVGTIWVAVGNAHDLLTHKLQLGKDRMKNIEYTANFALHLLIKFLRAH